MPFEMYVDESCHVGFMGKKEKENKPTTPAPGNLQRITLVMVPSWLSLDWTFLTTTLGQVWAHVCTVMCFCWISRRAWCGIYAGWCHDCLRYQTELLSSSSSLCCCVTGSLYMSTGPLTAANVSSWWAARGEEALVIHVPGPHNSVPACSSRADLPCP